MTSVVVVVVVGLLIRARCVATYTTPTHKVSVALRKTDVCLFVSSSACAFFFSVFCQKRGKKIRKSEKNFETTKGQSRRKKFRCFIFFHFWFFYTPTNSVFASA